MLTGRCRYMMTTEYLPTVPSASLALQRASTVLKYITGMKNETGTMMSMTGLFRRPIFKFISYAMKPFALIMTKNAAMSADPAASPEGMVVFDDEILRVMPQRIIKDRNQHRVHVPEEVGARQHRSVPDDEQRRYERHLHPSFERAHEGKQHLCKQQHRDEPEHTVRALTRPAAVEKGGEMFEYHIHIM